jgi:NAD(P)-dependent dehydrogenase (short-subunit alcohol dehydrogenase family)
MQAESEPLPSLPLPALTGLFLVSTETNSSLVTWMVEALARQGAQPVVLQLPALTDDTQLAVHLDALRSQYGSVTGIVHLAGALAQPMPESLAQWRQLAASQAKDLFRLLKACSSDLQQAAERGVGRVLSVSALGGYFGRQTAPVTGLALAGAGTGLLKTVPTEWPGLVAKAVDIDPTLAPEVIARQLIDEIRLPGGRVEVGYPQGVRTIFRTIVAPFRTQDSGWQPTADAVVLATGGARGITAELMGDLAPAKLTLIVTGQSPEPAPESELTRGVTDLAALRQVFLRQAIAQGEKVTPVLIERRVQALLKGRTTRENLDRFRQLGATVEYVAVDVRDEQAFGGLIQNIYQRFGRLDAVFHGAGIIEDKLIEDKTMDSFNRVFDTKVDSAYLLSRYLQPESLKLLVFFTSVAGRYGNKGQSDYAAANEVVNRLAWQLHDRWTQTRVVAVSWGPWDTTGMASEDVKRQFRDRGIVPIPLAAGREFFTAECCYGSRDAVEVIAGEGPWEAYEAEQSSYQAPVSVVNSAPWETPFVLVPRSPQLQPDSTVTLTYTLSAAQIPALQDHCLNGNPVLPAMGALEILAEFVQLGWPEWIVAEVCDLRVLRGLILKAPEGLTVQLRARAASHADAESLEVRAEILDEQGKLPYYRATVILRPYLESPLPFNPMPLDCATGLDAAAAYRNYLFHGPAFHLITGIEGTTSQGIDAQVRESERQGWHPQLPQDATWLFDPALLDTAPQLAIVWTRLNFETTALPSRVGRAVRYEGTEPVKSLRLIFRVTQADAHSLVYDAWFVDEQGNVRLELNQVEGTCNAALNRAGEKI